MQFVLDAFCPLLSRSRVKWFTDNQGAARIVQVGSMHFNLTFSLLVPVMGSIWRLKMDPALPEREGSYS